MHGGNRRETAERHGYPVRELLDFSASINPCGPPAGVLAAIDEARADIGHYPDDHDSLKTKLASHHGVAPENILLGNGTTELIYYLADRLRPKKLLVTAPSFAEYEWAVLAAGGVVLRSRLQHGFSLDEQDFLNKSAESEMVCLGNPNNPTGSLISRDFLHFLLNRPASPQLIIDEAFMDFVADGDTYSMLQEAARRPGLLVLRSLTKFFSMPGLRIGFLVGEKKAIRELERRKNPWSLNCFALAAAAAALDDQDFAGRTQGLVAAQRERLFQRLRVLPALRPFPSAANFILVRIDDPAWDAAKLLEALGRQRILIRDASSFAGLDDRFVRVAVRSETDNERLVEALTRLLVETAWNDGSVIQPRQSPDGQANASFDPDDEPLHGPGRERRANGFSDVAERAAARGKDV